MIVELRAVLLLICIIKLQNFLTIIKKLSRLFITYNESIRTLKILNANLLQKWHNF